MAVNGVVVRVYAFKTEANGYVQKQTFVHMSDVDSGTRGQGGGGPSDIAPHLMLETCSQFFELGPLNFSANFPNSGRYRPPVPSIACAHKRSETFYAFQGVNGLFRV